MDDLMFIENSKDMMKDEFLTLMKQPKKHGMITIALNP